jgi:hypothetical protein
LGRAFKRTGGAVGAASRATRRGGVRERLHGGGFGVLAAGAGGEEERAVSEAGGESRGVGVGSRLQQGRDGLSGAEGSSRGGGSRGELGASILSSALAGDPAREVCGEGDLARRASRIREGVVRPEAEHLAVEADGIRSVGPSEVAGSWSVGPLRAESGAILCHGGRVKAERGVSPWSEMGPNTSSKWGHSPWELWSSRIVMTTS